VELGEVIDLQGAATLKPGVTPEHIRAQVGQEWRAETEIYRWYLVAWELEENRGDTVFFTILLLYG
jgi:hypothetical protein